MKGLRCKGVMYVAGRQACGYYVQVPGNRPWRSSVSGIHMQGTVYTVLVEQVVTVGFGGMVQSSWDTIHVHTWVDLCCPDEQ